MVRTSVRGLLWSLTMLTVGAASSGPWLIVVVAVYWLYRRRVAKKATQDGAGA